jgi:hypothetical protein
MKHQSQVALDKASKSHDLMKKVSNLQDEISSLAARIAHFEECESFLIGIVKSVCEMLLCKSSKYLSSLFFLLSSVCQFLIELQVLALILLVNHIELLSGLLLFKMLHKEPKAYGPIPVIVALSCSSRIVPNTSAKLLMVVVMSSW